jgi:dTDP-glucose 4,6-dehydratase
MSDYTHPVNIGNPEEISILDFAEEIIELVGNEEVDIEFHPLPENDPMQRKPDISLAKELLGWGPSMNRREGLKQTLGYFKERVRKESQRD